MVKAREFDWLQVLDIKQALINCQIDLVGDWYRDPWGWPELEWACKNGAIVRSRLIEQVNGPVAKISVPKENFATRPAVVLDPIDRLCYQALVDRISDKIIGDLPRTVYGWRLDADSPQHGHYLRNDSEWRRYRGTLQRLAHEFDIAIKTDIVSCFASISIPLLKTEIEDRASKGHVAERLYTMLYGWSDVAGRSGLPQRAMASSVLANMYLSPLDDELHRRASATVDLFGREDPQSAIRWMDDVWIFGSDTGEVRRSLLAVEECTSGS